MRLEVDGIACVAYPRLTGEVEVGDDVLVNEQARLLELGSGGFDVLYANLTRGLGLAAEEGAHVMALPYTPGQVTVCCKEESDELAGLARGDAGRPLHGAQPGRARLRRARRRARRLRPGAGGALPVSLSDTVRTLRERGLLEVACRGRAVPRRRRPVRNDGGGARLGEGAGLRGRRLRRRAGDRRHRLAARARRAHARRRCQRRRRARRPSDPGRAPVGGRRPRTAPRRLAPCRDGARPGARGDRGAGRPRTARAGRKHAPGSRSPTWVAAPSEDPAFFRAAYAAGIAARRMLG